LEDRDLLCDIVWSVWWMALTYWTNHERCYQG